MTCTCGQDMRECRIDGAPRLLCYDCQRVTMLDGSSEPPRALKLPGLDRGKQSQRIQELESKLVQRIRETLQSHGYIVIRLGQYRADHAGNDKGAPDMIVSRLEWGNRWVACEVKLPGAPYSGEQQRKLCEQGSITRVESVAEAMEAVK